MATPTTAFNLSGLALRLVREGLLQQADAEEIHNSAMADSRSFFAELVKTGKVEGADLARAASEEFGVPYLDISSIDKEEMPVSAVDEKIMRRHLVLPLYKRGTKLFLGISDPTNTGAMDEVKFNTGLGIEPVLIDHLQLPKMIEAMLDAQDTSLGDLADESLEDIDIAAGEEGGDEDQSEDSSADTPIVRFVNKMLLDAINKGASDIHMEPYETAFRVRYRVDGVLHEAASPPLSLAGRIAARVKILSRLDIAERRVPQDGRMKMRISKSRSIDFRVSTLPTLFGEKVVIRVLDSGAAKVGVEKLGFEKEQEKAYMEAIQRPYGMVLVTGPTGSGKTVSLYTALNILNTVDRNVSTVEDPVEINLAGINQVNINDKAGLTFASALKAFLRQDPDIIMVGEIRDLETAEIAIKAAQTGHMVLSTLHTNDAPATLSRLLNMGVAPFNIASAVNLIMAQRLARRLCEKCKQEMEIPPAALLEAGFREDELDGLTVFGPQGCDSCTDGYKGRVGIFQVMPISEEMGKLIMQGGSQHEIEAQAEKEGVADLRQSGLRKVKSGVTSLAEVERVTNQ
jgi:type IV pilus assembly protein PilB